MVKNGIEVKADKSKDIVRAFKELAFTEVLVGIPQEKSSRKDNEITNAELAYIHTHGSPVNNIPPRPFLQPSIIENIEGVTSIQSDIVKAALAGNSEKVKKLYNRLGLYVQAKAKNYITQGDKLAPNAPMTIALKGSDRPLIDTAQMLNSITYVVKTWLMYPI